jgi:pyrroloquinoline quinone biosynthesis protein E
MTLADFKALIDQQYGLLEVKLQGMGEPLMQGDEFFEMIKYARKSHIWVRLATNASLLHLNDNYKKLASADPNEIQISVDGADKSVFEKIRKGSVFERVVENCKIINSYYREQCIPLPTKMWVVVQKANLHQLNELVELAHETGFKKLVFSLNLTDWGQENWNRENTNILVEDSLDQDLAGRLVENGRNLDVDVTFWSVTRKYSSDSPELLCAWPFERAYVSSDMRVVPCCMIANPEVSDLGSGNFFTETWNCEDYQNFRNAHLTGQIPKICRGCYYEKHAADD